MIRAATAQDVTAMTALVLEHDRATVQLLAEHSSEGYVARALHNGLLQPGTWAEVYAPQDRIAGLFLGHFCKAIFAPSLIAEELLWWITPAARGTTAAMRLWRNFEDEAKRRGARLIGMRDMSGEMGRHYRRNGYQPIEQVWGRLI